jgi:tRNA modification GTPase
LAYPRGDTVAALATAPGGGAIAVVRLSGPAAPAIARELTGIEARPRHAELCTFRDEHGQRIDRGLLLLFPAPRSYTGEDVVELHGHGGPIVSDWLMGRVCALGARPAEPGEFTLRAFLNDKLDLVQAEAVADLVASGSRLAARAALRSLEGQFSSSVEALQSELTAIRVHAEAWLDFPDEELDAVAAAALGTRLDALVADLESLLLEARHGAVLRDGLSVALAGPPNAGKSSLLNRLAGHEAAIVTDVPGTTRDVLREHLSLDGLPVSVVDTAGLRTANDPVEREGLRRAHAELGKADRVLWIMDVRAGLEAAVEAASRELGAAMPFTVVQNKIDLVEHPAAVVEVGGTTAIRLSALTGEGLELLTAHLKALAGWSGEARGTFSARRRHVDALRRALRCLVSARAEWPRALELAAEELRGAQTALGELTGELTSDDLLGRIFSSFCIGK